MTRHRRRHVTGTKDLAGSSSGGWGADIGWVSLPMEWLPSCHGEMGEVPQLPTHLTESLLHHQNELRLHFTRLCSSICCKSPFKKLRRLVGFLKYQHPLRARVLQCQHQASVPRTHHFDTQNLSSHQGSSAGQPAGAKTMCSREICKKIEIFRLNRGLKEKRQASYFSVLCFLCLP